MSDGTAWNSQAITGALQDINSGRNSQIITDASGNMYMISGAWGRTTSTKTFKSADGGATWTDLGTHTFDIAPACQATNGKNTYGFNFLASTNKFYVWGGSDNTFPGTVYNDVYSSVDGVTWVRVTPAAPFSARQLVANSIIFNSLIFMVGGFAGSTISDVWTFNGTTWTQVSSSPGFSLASGSNLVYNSINRIWIFIPTTTTTLDIYWSSTGAGIWTQSGVSLSIPHQAGLFLGPTYNGSMWLIGRNNLNVNTIYKTALGSALTTVLSGTPFNSPVSNAAGSFYTFGGVLQFIQENSSVSFTLYTSTTNAAAGNSFPLTPTVPNLLFNFTNSSAAAGQNGFVFKSTSDAYAFNNNILTKITDPQYPTVTVPGIVYLDGTYYVMDNTGKIFGSDLDNPLSWTALNVISMNASPDNPVAIAKHLTYVAAFGTFSVEFFYDAGNPLGSPLLPVTSAYLDVGCAAAGSIVNCNNTVFFMGVTRQKGRSIYMFEGVQPKVVSNEYIDRILNADSLATIYSFTIKISGHIFYVITLKASGITLAYDTTSGQWAEWTSLTAGSSKSVTSLTNINGTATATVTSHGYSSGQVVTIAGGVPSAYNGTFIINVTGVNTFTYPVATSTASPATGTITSVGYTESFFNGVTYTSIGTFDVVQGETDGIVYQLDPSYTNDNGVPIRYFIRTPKLDAGNINRKFYTYLNVVGDKVSATAYVRYTDDDYQTFSTFRPVDLSSARSRINRLGNGRRRAFEVVNADSQLIRLESLEVDINEGSK